MNISQKIDEINHIIRVSDRPEFTLMQRYETAHADQKITFITALIGLVIEKERRESANRIG
jgi:hypothetical protein